jgi:GDP-L-fucose synthase
MSKILILGGYGFMGKNLNEVFKNSDHTIYNESIRTGCDIRLYNRIVETIQRINPDIIINAAAHVGSIAYVSKYSANVVHDNTLMYINLYKAISETNKNIIVINPISNCSYPGIIDVQNEENWWDGEVHESIEAYGVPKKMGYIISECYRRQHGIKTVNLIVSNAYGPNDHLNEERTHAMSGIIMRMIKSQINKDEDFVVWGSGKPIREWVYMPDVARLIKQIIDKNDFDRIPNPINVGQENGISIIESVQMIKNFLNYDVNIITDLTKQDGAPIKVLGKKKFVETFPNFQFTGFPEGINNTINYYKALIK